MVMELVHILSKYYIFLKETNSIYVIMFSEFKKVKFSYKVEK